MLTTSRVILFLYLAALAGTAFAQQTPIVTIRVFTDTANARFVVDGQHYAGPTTFHWPQGSKHILEALVSFEDVGGGTRYAFASWEESTGKLLPGSDPVQTVTADPSVTFYKASYSAVHRVYLLFYNSPNVSESNSPPICGAPGSVPHTGLRPGVVYFGGACYWNSGILWVPAGLQTLNAFPYPGFVFSGWSINHARSDAYLTAYNVTGPATITAQFQPAKRVSFRTSPPGLQVLIDRTPVLTNDQDRCALSQRLPPFAPAGVIPLCWGDFDWAMDSTHILAVPEHQVDMTGNDWVFESWSNGGGQNTPYTVKSLQPAETITAKFAPGAKVGLSTSPPGLKLAVDGTDHWPSHFFVWRVGSKHQLTAPGEQVDSAGRRYKFHSWSNGAAASQEITVDEAWVKNSPRLTAKYELLGRVTLETSPTGLPLRIDGEECRTPCKVDRVAGTQVNISAHPTLPGAYENSRFAFKQWSDSSAAERMVTVPANESNAIAHYQLQYLLLATSDPAEAVLWRMQPGSPDRYFDADSEVTVRAESKPGFRFLGWDGDLQGPSNAGTLKMNAPRAIRAILRRVPFLSADSVRNAASDTILEVAPGSVISIFGANMAFATEIGPLNPLKQALAGVTVRVNTRLLPLFFVSPAQINAQLPYDLGEGTHKLIVQSEGQPEVSTEFSVVRNAPGLFNSQVDERSFGAIRTGSGDSVTIDRPARIGETLTVFATGLGPYDRKPPEGFALPEDTTFQLADQVDLIIAEQAYRPDYAGASDAGSGINALRFRLTPEMASAPILTLRVRVNGRESNTVLVSVGSALP